MNHKSGFTALLILLCLFAILSCRKDEKWTTPEPAPVYEGPPVYAGIFDSTFYSYQFPAPVEIPIVWDSAGVNATGTKWLDINGDSINDMALTLSIDHPDSDQVDNSEVLQIRLNDSIEVAMVAENNCYFGSCNDLWWVDALNYSERIDVANYDGIPRYYDGQDYYHYLWYYFEWSAGDPSRGVWYYVTGTRYIAFRIKPFRHGWIEMEMTDPENPKIVSYAVQK